jgi:hypothetical protein
MKRICLIVLVVLLTSGAGMPPRTAGAALAQSPSDRPITLEGLTKAARIGGLPTSELVESIRRRGVNFQMTADAERQLRTAGAAPAVIQAARENYRGQPAARADANHSAEGKKAAVTVKEYADVLDQFCNENVLGSCFYLGLIYVAGVLPENNSKVVQLFTRSCDRGEMIGCNGLGQAYADGLGVTCRWRER